MLELSVYFRSELKGVCQGDEVDAMWKWWLAEHLPNQTDPIRRDPSVWIDDDVLLKVKSDLMRLKTGEPFQYVLGYSFFFGMRLSVDKRVLIPRPETEEMIELITKQSDFYPETIVDVCTGSGCIALGFKKCFPDSQVVAVDVSNGAVELASVNARELGLDVRFIIRDVLSNNGFEGLPQGTHLVVSNPPYILPSEAGSMQASVLEHEPSMALFVPQEDPLLFYLPIATYARMTLVPGGQLWFEINPMKAEQLLDLLQKLGFASASIVTDLSGKARFAKAVQPD